MDNKKKVSYIVVCAILLIIGVLFVFTQGAEGTINTTQGDDFTMTLPFVEWEVDFRETGLVVTSIIIGLLDGFNPCAMWVLIYLITLASNIQDKRKMWFIVGTFLITSGVLYFIILALWLNGWELLGFLGFTQWVLYAVGGFALFTGILSIQNFIEKGGQITCEVGDLETRSKTMLRIKDIIHSPITLASIIATIILAFVINSIEFLCSAGLPAMYTQLLSVADVSTAFQYLNIGIYTLAFMFDDILIFSLALMAINSAVMHKYSGLSKLLGGIIMIGIGIILLFFPELLM